MRTLIKSRLLEKLSHLEIGESIGKWGVIENHDWEQHPDQPILFQRLIIIVNRNTKKHYKFYEKRYDYEYFKQSFPRKELIEWDKNVEEGVVELNKIIKIYWEDTDTKEIINLWNEKI